MAIVTVVVEVFLSGGAHSHLCDDFMPNLLQDAVRQGVWFWAL